MYILTDTAEAMGKFFGESIPLESPYFQVTIPYLLFKVLWFITKHGGYVHV